MPREATIVQRIRKAVRAKYPTAFVMKLADRFTRGVPDLLIVFRRHNRMDPDLRFMDSTGVLFVETKTKDGVMSEIQRDTVRKLLGIAPHGCNAIVATTVDEVLTALDMMGAVG